MLNKSGLMEYLVLEPEGINSNTGTYSWTSNLSIAKNNAKLYFPNSEGIDVHNGRLYFVTKMLKIMYILNLDDGTYIRQSTRGGVFVGQPDQIVHITKAVDSLLYFTEDGGQFAGVNARDQYGQYFTIFEGTGRYSDETTGLSFSPDLLHMYVAYQDEGTLLDVFREDGLPFNGNTLNVKYHSVDFRY
jgi:outer membrane protein assembly factor BamB